MLNKKVYSVQFSSINQGKKTKPKPKKIQG